MASPKTRAIKTLVAAGGNTRYGAYVITTERPTEFISGAILNVSKGDAIVGETQAAPELIYIRRIYTSQGRPTDMFFTILRTTIGDRMKAMSDEVMTIENYAVSEVDAPTEFQLDSLFMPLPAELAALPDAAREMSHMLMAPFVERGILTREQYSVVVPLKNNMVKGGVTIRFPAAVSISIRAFVRVAIHDMTWPAGDFMSEEDYQRMQAKNRDVVTCNWERNWDKLDQAEKAKNGKSGNAISKGPIVTSGQVPVSEDWKVAGTKKPVAKKAHKVEAPVETSASTAVVETQPPVSVVPTLTASSTPVAPLKAKAPARPAIPNAGLAPLVANPVMAAASTGLNAWSNGAPSSTVLSITVTGQDGLPTSSSVAYNPSIAESIQAQRQQNRAKNSPIAKPVAQTPAPEVPVTPTVPTTPTAPAVEPSPVAPKGSKKARKNKNKPVNTVTSTPAAAAAAPVPVHQNGLPEPYVQAQQYWPYHFSQFPALALNHTPQQAQFSAPASVPQGNIYRNRDGTLSYVAGGQLFDLVPRPAQ